MHAVCLSGSAQLHFWQNFAYFNLSDIWSSGCQLRGANENVNRLTSRHLPSMRDDNDVS